MPRLQTTLTTLAMALATAGLITACGGGSDSESTSSTAVSVPNTKMFFNRVSTFAVCSQVGSSCESNDVTSAEIAAASTDGMTVIYTNSPKKEIGFVDITTPSAPVALGALAMGGEPTSVAVVGSYALVAVNTSPSFTAPTGKLVVVDIAKRSIVTEIDMGGQPDSVAVSKDGLYAAVVIENERDESVNSGAIPQLPAGALKIVDLVGVPSAWKARSVDLTGIATLYGTDPEPEYVSINSDNVAVVSLQENNHLALVDLKTGVVTKHFSAGTVTLDKIDLIDAPRPNQIALTESKSNILREPDGVAWISSSVFATANEGDLNGGSRSFSLFKTDGTVAFDSGNALEHLAARLGHYNDKRSDAKGNEPENVAFARYGTTDYLFVASERSSLLAVYDMSDATKPALKQALPGAISPEGILTIPSRNLVISASEIDDRGLPARSALNIYAYQDATVPAYPAITSVDRADGTPIPWAALSGMAAAATGTTVYTIEDSFFRGNRIFEMDVSATPAVIRKEITIKDTNDVFKNFGATLPAAKDNQAFDQTDVTAMINTDKSVNIDPEGISIASAGGFWIASEGNGSVTAYESGRNILSANLVFKVSATGVIEEVIALPPAWNAKQARYGFEGVAEHAGKLVVAIQRSWEPAAKAGNPAIGVYDLTSKTWIFLSYPIDPVSSPNGGWVGLSEITAIGNNQFLVVERDNQMGPDARIKRLYKIDITGKADGALLTKTLVRDLLPDLLSTKGLALEKIEGLAVLADGQVMFSTDNDGVDEHGGGGESQLIRLGKILN